MSKNKSKEKRTKNFLKIFLMLFTLILMSVSGGVIYFLYNYTVPIVVSGTSMTPTFHEQDKLIMKIKDYTLDVGDIVSFQAPDNPEDYYVKRVIGLAGDTVEYKDDMLYVNGKYVSEPYLNDLKNSDRAEKPVTPDFNIATLTSTLSEVVPEGYIFVLGDNRIDSKDSRFFGFVNLQAVEGKVIFPNKSLNK